MDHSDQSLQWDIFCKVIDNFGDVGICWRLAADLASRGQQVRVWIDDASALRWMAPHGQPGVSVLAWGEYAASTGQALVASSPTGVLVEAFGCDVPSGFMAACAAHAAISGKNPVWINLEYLSAEPYAERNHGLPSHVASGPAAGWEKWFFYPGFTPRTGGLLRERDLAARQQTFARDDWLKTQGISSLGKTIVSLFCYEPQALKALLQQFAEQGLDRRPVHLLVAEGRARLAVQALQNISDLGQLKISYLPLLTQTDFDHLLWSCDLNFVRGEDSIVRAIWAGKPFVWQIYPQDDGVHSIKLDAFLGTIEAPAGLRNFHHAWNAGAGEPDSDSLVIDLQAWQTCASDTKNRLMAMPDLTSSLMEFVHKNR